MDWAPFENAQNNNASAGVEKKFDDEPAALVCANPDAALFIKKYIFANKTQKNPSLLKYLKAAFPNEYKKYRRHFEISNPTLATQFSTLSKAIQQRIYAAAINYHVSTLSPAPIPPSLEMAWLLDVLPTYEANASKRYIVGDDLNEITGLMSWGRILWGADFAKMAALKNLIYFGNIPNTESAMNENVFYKITNAQNAVEVQILTPPPEILNQLFERALTEIINAVLIGTGPLSWNNIQKCKKVPPKTVYELAQIGIAEMWKSHNEKRISVFYEFQQAINNKIESFANTLIKEIIRSKRPKKGYVPFEIKEVNEKNKENEENEENEENNNIFQIKIEMPQKIKINVEKINEINQEYAPPQIITFDFVKDFYFADFQIEITEKKKEVLSIARDVAAKNKREKTYIKLKEFFEKLGKEVLTTQELLTIVGSKPNLKNMVENGHLIKVGHGKYALKSRK